MEDKVLEGLDKLSEDVSAWTEGMRDMVKPAMSRIGAYRRSRRRGSIREDDEETGRLKMKGVGGNDKRTVKRVIVLSGLRRRGCIT